MLIDVLPDLARDDLMDKASVNIEAGCERGQCTGPSSSASVGSADGADVVLAQFGVLIRLALQALLVTTSVLAHTISDVVGVRSEKQVRRPHAKSVVAPVEDVHVGRNRPMSEPPRNPVALFALAVDAEVRVAGIAVRFRRALKEASHRRAFPAPVSRNNMNGRYESLEGRQLFSWHAYSVVGVV